MYQGTLWSQGGDRQWRAERDPFPDQIDSKIEVFKDRDYTRSELGEHEGKCGGLSIADGISEDIDEFHFDLYA